MPVSLIASKKMTYAGRNYVAGQPFDARDDSDATILKRDRVAVDAPVKAKVMAPDPVEPPAPEPVLDAIVEPTEHLEEGSPAPPRRRRYVRKDMQAE